MIPLIARVGVFGTIGIIGIGFSVYASLKAKHNYSKDYTQRNHEAYIQLGFAVSIIISIFFNNFWILFANVIYLIILTCALERNQHNEAVTSKQRLRKTELLDDVVKHHPGIRASLAKQMERDINNGNYKHGYLNVDVDKIIHEGLNAEKKRKE